MCLPARPRAHMPAHRHAQLPRGLKLKVMDFYKIKYPNRRMFEEDILLDKLENEVKQDGWQKRKWMEGEIGK